MQINSTRQSLISSMMSDVDVAKTALKTRVINSAKMLLKNIGEGMDIIDRNLDKLDSKVSRKTHRGPQLENLTTKELYGKAKEMDISGRSEMTKAELIEAIREEW